jgi:hypothetical protein
VIRHRATGAVAEAVDTGRRASAGPSSEAAEACRHLAGAGMRSAAAFRATRAVGCVPSAPAAGDS